MAENVEEKIVFTGDASQLTQTFDELVNAITKTREELKQYKDDKEKSAQLTEQLAQQETKLVELMAKNNNVIDASNVSYRQLNDILKDLNKTYKSVNDSAQRMNIAPAAKAINSELKQMDANIGNFQRNVGNYSGDITKAFDGIQMQTNQLLRELPSLKYGVEMFFLAISNNLPMFADAIKKYNDLRKARKASTEDATLDAAAHRSESTTTGESTLAHEGETKAVTASAAAHLKEAEAAYEDAKAKKANAEAVRDSLKARESELTTRMGAVQATIKEVTSKQTVYRTDLDEIASKRQLNKLLLEQKELEYDLSIASLDLSKAEVEVATATKEVEVAERTLNEQRKKENPAGALQAIIKTLLSWQTLMLVGIMVLTMYGKDILEWVKSLKLFNTEAKRAAKFQKEWNDQMKEGHKNAVKQIVDLQMYSRWATMSTKSDKERTIAAKEVLKTMGSAITETNIAAVKNGEYQKSIDDVTNALIKQAQAQAMMNKITEKYKDVIDAQDKLADAQNGKIDAIGAAGMAGSTMYSPTLGIGSMPTAEETQQAIDNAIQGSIDRAQAAYDRVKEDFETWMSKFREDFNPSDLLFGKDGGKGDKWFSKWELYIKQYEASLLRIQGEYEELDLAAIWKYSAEGMEYYLKMYDEYIEHYVGDEKQFKEAQINKEKYLKEFNEYHLRLQKQYMDSTKTEYQVEMDKLEEWYAVQKAIYKNAGEETTGLEAEYTKRKEDILNKYIDRYKNIDMVRQAIDERYNEFYSAMMDYELAQLQDQMDKEIREYERKGIETTNLEEHYAIERMKIISKYAKEETQARLAEYKKQEDAALRRNAVETNRNMRTGGKDTNTESIFASMGGTTVTGMDQRNAEIAGLEEEKRIYEESANLQIAEMQRVLDSGKLFGEERLEMEKSIADAKNELELGTLELQEQIEERKAENAKATFEEITQYAQQSFQGLGGMFDNVYTAIEKTYELQVKEGKMSEEEAEKELEKYRGVKAAAAAMDALSSAVGAYNSLASIPYVGPALGAAAAAAALAAGFANVKLIMATTKDNAGVGGADTYSPSLSEYTPQYVSNITGRDDTDYLANALEEKPIKAYVVTSEITAAQEVENQVDAETTF